MYFYSINKLKDRLKSGQLSERESVPYLIISAAFIALFAYFPSPPENLWDYVSLSISLALAILGTIWLYQKNGGSDGKDFIYRYIILGFVVIVRYITAMLPVIILYLCFYYYSNDSSDETTWFDCVILVSTELLFYWYFGKQIGDLHEKQKG
jgi:hypothetical protein